MSRTITLAPSAWSWDRKPSRAPGGPRTLLPATARMPPRDWLRDDARRIYLQLRSHGAGDVVNLLPLVHELATRHPHATVFVVTNHDTVPFDRCAANVRVLGRLADGEPDDAACYLDLEPWVRYHLRCPHWLQYLVIAGVGSVTLRDDPFPLLERGVPARLAATLQSRPYVLVHARNSRSQWQGRNSDRANLHHITARLRARGLAVFEVANDANDDGELPRLGTLSVTELLQVMRGAAAFVGIDSFPMHAAALYDKPLLGFFGATHPQVVLTPTSRLITLRNEALGCNGCVYVTRPVGYNECHFGDQRCGERLPTDYLDQQVDALLTLLDEDGARVALTPAVRLEHELRSSQLVYEEALVIEELRRAHPVERLRARLDASGRLRQLGNLVASVREQLRGKRP